MSVEFKVPGDFVVQQSPQNLPPVYNGEKMVVYGVLSPKSTPQDRELSGKAILKGQILGKKMEHSVPFSLNPVATRSPSIPAIHHLAAKALIKDWQDQGKSKEEIVKLSVDSSVISSHTAFIAVDEESSEPVTGAMKTWDVQAQQQYFSPGYQSIQPQCASVRSAMSSNIDQVLSRGDHLDDLAVKAECLNASAATFSKSANRAKKGGGFSFGSLFSGFTSLLYGSRSEAAQLQLDVNCASEGRSVDLYSADLDCDKELDIDDSEEELECMSVSPRAGKLEDTSPKPQSASGKKLTLTEPTALTSIITAQQADGSWMLDSTLTQSLAKPQKVIEDACPIKCDKAISVIWATVLILTLLKKKYSSQQDEWELIAMKAESWVKKQAQSSGIAVKDFYTAAEMFV